MILLLDQHNNFIFFQINRLILIPVSNQYEMFVCTCCQRIKTLQ